MSWFRKPVLESEFEWTFDTNPRDYETRVRLENFLGFYFDRALFYTAPETTSDPCVMVEKGDFTLCLAKGDTIRVRRFTNGKTWVRYETGNRYLEVEL